ncbi:hypothetical protein [Rhizobium sp. 11_C7_N12_5]|uniref:hypothetical protein n=1 Tax=Rhizobium sp. 11_C7_N12_5 TaxID=3240770 RepID=UPI003F21C3B7
MTFRRASLFVFYSFAMTLVCSQAPAQSAIEHHAWQDKRKFSPYSRTAQAITGSIKLSGNAVFASEGSKMTIEFGNGKRAQLTSVGASWRQWDFAPEQKTTAEVFKIAKDPDILLNGNTLCGNPKTKPARYIVFFEQSSLGDQLLGVAVFESAKPPHDINSVGLCGTFNYSID